MEEYLILYESHQGERRHKYCDSYSEMVINLSEIIVDPTVAHWRMYEGKVSGYKAADWNHNER